MAVVGPVIYQIYVNGVLFKDLELVLDVELRQEFSRHDLFFLRIEYPRNYPKIYNVITWDNNTPVEIIWGRTPDLNIWYGYVNHSEILSNADSGTNAQQVTYTLIGTSAYLNIDRFQVWQNVSPTYIAKQIATQNKMRCVVTPVTTLLPYEVQAGESDFTFMNRIADKTGMRFWCSGGTLYLIAPNIAIYGSSNLAVPIFSFNKGMGYQDTVRNFRLLQGANLPGAVVANRSVYGIDANSGALISATAPPISQGNPTKTKTGTNLPTSTTEYINTTRAVTSQAEANDTVNSWQTLSQYWVGATCQLFGDTLLYPGKLIQLTGVGLMDGMAGYWLITSARHLLKSVDLPQPALDRYLTDVTMVRNSGAYGGKLLLKGEQRVTPEMTRMVLNGGVWASVNQGVVTTGFQVFA